MSIVYAGAAVESRAAPERVFEVLTDWPRHQEWMFLTRAELVDGEIAAFSGIGTLGFLDTMRITRWDPPHALWVEHTGRVVRGRGAIRVRPLAGGGSRVIWAEEVEVPFAALLWPLLQPIVTGLARRSLRKLTRLAGSGP
ncbi:SRPBCC family protein [Nonomuraea sp. NPDC050556]|uniref:SRPBCC family protein n=1 Tax=Nonomuraea sp. NPDC050556 TaxID=3364369 RepID=UPI0037A2C788